MSVAVRIPTMFRKHTEGNATVEVDRGTLQDIVSQLDSRYPGIKSQILSEDGELHKFVNVYVNDEDVRYLEKLETKILDGDTVSLLPSVAGGAG